MHPSLFNSILLAQRAMPEINFTNLLMGAVLVVAAVVGLVCLVVLWNFGSLWLQAKMSGADISMGSLIGMYFRQVRSAVIVNAKIMAAQAGLNIDRSDGVSTQRLEAHYLAEGNVMNVLTAIIAANRAGIDLDFDRACAIDLAGRDVLDAVRTSVHPRVIDCPDPRYSPTGFLSAIAKNGIELKVKARVTVRTNLEWAGGGSSSKTAVTESVLPLVDLGTLPLEEYAIAEAKKILSSASPQPEGIRVVSEKLMNFIQAHDLFWIRWNYFAQQHGIDL